MTWELEASMHSPRRFCWLEEEGPSKTRLFVWPGELKTKGTPKKRKKRKWELALAKSSLGTEGGPK